MSMWTSKKIKKRAGCRICWTWTQMTTLHDIHHWCSSCGGLLHEFTEVFMEGQIQKKFQVGSVQC